MTPASILQYSPAWPRVSGNLCCRVSSVWLTAFALTTLSEIQADPELQRTGLHVDAGLLEAAVRWLVAQQAEDGSFEESDLFPDPSQAPVELRQISVTSQALAGLATLRRWQQVADNNR